MISGWRASHVADSLEAKKLIGELFEQWEMNRSLLSCCRLCFLMQASLSFSLIMLAVKISVHIQVSLHLVIFVSSNFNILMHTGLATKPTQL